MRKLLIVTFHFPPSAASGSFRMLGFARHLPKLGWEPLIVAPPKMPEEPKDLGLAETVPAGTRIFSVPFPRGRFIRAMRRLVPYAVWLPRAWLACCRVVQRFRPDALLTSSPPHCVHLLGYHLHRRFNLPWVADFRDPWITGGNPNRRHRFRLPWEARWERKVITRAEVVVANAPGAALRLQEAYPPYHHKIKTILNGYDRQNLEGLSAAHRSNGTLEILHTGELYAGRDPRPFLDAIQLLRWNSRPVRVRFLGRTDMGDRRFRAEIQRRGLDSFIDVGEQVPYTQAIQAMIDADILMLLDTPGRRVGIPAKLYEYIGVGRPVLALAERDSDVAWALRESGIPHRVASASDPLQIKQALAELMAAVDDNHAEFSRQEQRSLFTREGMARQLAEIMTAALEEKLSC